MPWKERNNMYGKSNPLIKLFEGLTRVDLSGVSFNEGKVPDPSKESPEAQAKKLTEEDGAPKMFDVTQEIAQQLATKFGAQVNIDEFMKGLKHEGTEHIDVTKGDPEITAQLVLPHLKEIPDYYTRLFNMEEEAKKVPAKAEGKPEQDAGKETMPAAESIEISFKMPKESLRSIKKMHGLDEKTIMAEVAKFVVAEVLEQVKTVLKEIEEPTKLTVIASDIADEQEAKKIQTGKPGSIVQQDPTTKKFSVVIKESNRVEFDCNKCKHKFMGMLEDKPKKCPKCGSTDLNYEYKDGAAVKEIAGRDIADEKKEPVFTDTIMQQQYEDLLKTMSPEEAKEKVRKAHAEYFGKSAKFYGVADEAAKKYQKTGEFAFPVYEFGIELFGNNWERKHDSNEVFNELSTPKGEGIAKKWLEQEIKAAKAKGIKVDSIKFSETDSGNYTHAGAYYTVVLTVDPKVEGPDGEIAKVMGEDKIVWPKETSEKVKAAKKAKGDK